MPSILAHCFYGDSAIAQCGIDVLMEGVRRNHGLFMLGCQGPDFFYFYHRLPWHTKRRCPQAIKFANILHEEHINKTFSIMLREVRKSRDEKDIVYAAGFLCHWALDVICHPYVYYRTGSRVVNSGPDHRILEAGIDRGVLNENGLKLEDYAPKKLIAHSRDASRHIWRLLKPVFAEADELKLDYRMVDESVEQFHSMYKLLHDPKGTRYHYIGLLERLFKQDGMATSLMIPVNYDEQLDPLNLRHEKWLDPCSGQQHHESFTELAGRAVGLMIQMLRLYVGYLNDTVELSEILEVIGDRSFNSGSRCDLKMQYFRKDM